MAVPVPLSLCDDDYAWLHTNVSDVKRKKAERMHRPQDAYRTLIGEVLARTMVSSALDSSYHNIVFEHNHYGKPMLPDNPSIHFNVSHSGQWVVCLLGSCPVGVDVEEVAAIDMELGKTCFAPEEYESILREKGESRLSRFYELWTLKESYSKAIGRGLSLPLQSFRIEIDSNRSISIHAGGEPCFFRLYDWGERYKLAACSMEEHFPASVEAITLAQLKEEAASSSNR
ncbi:4'-phosphopantetheinyl transferase superfamily protein [Paenibacillus sp. J5C_2022]|nr:4'-phosphopantetheinyl transferase superfamily protein [Paenibacillus sp. J5C2022]